MNGPRQNRVTPLGEIVISPARGTLMGNRGCLHDTNGNIGNRRWTTKTWVCCLLEFGGWKRELMQAGSYTELFFLDEVTALSAGHRPCATCRRTDYNSFLAKSSAETAAQLNDMLHLERTRPLAERPIVKGRDLVFGAVGTPDDGNTFIVKAPDKFLQWNLEGYTAAADHVHSTMRLVTPLTAFKALDAGYVPLMHPSAEYTG